MTRAGRDAMDAIVLERFPIEIDANEVRRLLGRKDGSAKEHDPRAERAIADGLEAARSLVEPKGIYLYAAGRDLPGSAVFAHLARMAFAVCTIGPRLEAEVTELSKKGELLRAVVLDAIGSTAAEATADAIDRRIAAEAEAQGLRTSCRASPGYGDWDVREQRAIFALVPAGRVGVTLGESCMMMPRKSVSFAVHVAAQPEMLRSENSCENCQRRDCAFRH